MQQTDQVQQQQQQHPSDILENLLIKMDEDEHPESLFKALSLLEKILTNIANNPIEDKFRHIKTTNAALKAKLFNISMISQVLTGVGFVLSDDSYNLPDQNLGTLLGVIGVVRDYASLADCKLNKQQTDVDKQMIIIKERQEHDQQQRVKAAQKQQLQERIEYDNENRKHFEKGVASKKVQGPGFGKGKKVTAQEVGCIGSKGG